MDSLKQPTLNLNPNAKKTRKQVFFEQMEQVVPWADLVSLFAPYYPEGKNGRPPFPFMTMLRDHFMQHWLTLSDPAMQEAFFDTPLLPSLRNSKSLHGCPMSPPSCGSAIAWESTSLLSKYSPLSTSS